jgi:putative FmdB family regulatory protein
MPVYEYRCAACGETLEIIVLSTTDEPKECPKCHGVLERILSPHNVKVN